MISLSKKFWVIGTSVNKYFENYYLQLNHLDIFTEIEIIDEHYILLPYGGGTLNYGSKATLQQNLACWQALGFILKKSKNKYIKIVECLNKDKLYEYSKWMLLVPTNDERIKTYRSMVIHIMIANLDIDLIKNNFIESIRSEKVDFLKIKKSISDYEKELLSDDEYKKIIKLIGEYYNDK